MDPDDVALSVSGSDLMIPANVNPNMDDVFKVLNDFDEDFDVKRSSSSEAATTSAEAVRTLGKVPPPALDRAEQADSRLAVLTRRQQDLERRFRDESVSRRVNLLRSRALGTHAVGEVAKVRAYAQATHTQGGSQQPKTPTKAPEPAPPVTSTPQKEPSPPKEKEEEEARLGAPPPLTSQDRLRAEEALGATESNLRHLIHNYDSEATESSSGGESCDELDHFPASADAYMPVKKRAKYTWLSNRASIAARWTWLTAQISDLEYRIRQMTDIYRTIRVQKGAVTLGEPVVSWPPHARKPQLPPQQQQLPLSCKPPTKDYSRVDSQGRKIIIKEPSSSPADAASAASDTHQPDDGSQGACRTRPLKMLRRRRYLSTALIARTSPRATKETSVRCDCPLPTLHCAICFGRANHTQAADPVTMERRQCLALLDHSYHAVLSSAVPGREEVPLEIQMMQKVKNRSWLSSNSGLSLNQLIRDGEREKKKYIKKLKKESMSEGGAGAAAASTSAASSSAAAAAADDAKPSTSSPAGSKHMAHMQRYKKRVKKKVELPPAQLRAARRLKTASTSEASASATSATSQKQPPRRKSLTIHHHSDDRLHSIADLGGDDLISGVDGASPVPSPSVSNQTWAEHIRRKRETAFDIDNIVIPYSMAAATRVERIKYKEILTPTWRSVGPAASGAQEEAAAATETAAAPPVAKKPKLVEEEEKKNEEKEKKKEEKGDVPKDKEGEKEEPEASEPAPAPAAPPAEEAEEDVSEAVYEARHAKAELEEQRRWQTPLWKSSGGQRQRASRRQDSRTDRTDPGSSGYNTPDPLSPGMVDRVDTLEVNTRPSTPTEEAAAASNSGPSTPTSTMAASIRNRRRTSSVTKSRDRNPSEDPPQQASRCTTPVQQQQGSQQELELIEPFDPRAFPLSAEDYQLMLDDMPPPRQQPSAAGGPDAQQQQQQQQASSSSEQQASQDPSTPKAAPSKKRPSAPPQPPRSGSMDDSFEEMLVEDDEEELEEEDPDWNQEELEEEADDPDDPEWAGEDQAAGQGGGQAHQAQKNKGKK